MDVEEDQVRRERAKKANGFFAIARLSGNLSVLLRGEQLANAASRDGLIVNDQDTHRRVIHSAPPDKEA